MSAETFPLDERDPLAAAIDDAMMEAVLAGYAAKQLILELNAAARHELGRALGTARWATHHGVVPIRDGPVNAIVIAESEDRMPDKRLTTAQAHNAAQTGEITVHADVPPWQRPAWQMPDIPTPALEKAPTYAEFVAWRPEPYPAPRVTCPDCGRADHRPVQPVQCRTPSTERSSENLGGRRSRRKRGEIMSDADIHCRACGKPLFRFRRPLPHPGSVARLDDLIPMPGVPAPTQEGLLEWPCCPAGSVELGAVLEQLWAGERSDE